MKAMLYVAVAFGGGLLAGNGVVREAWAQGKDPYEGLDTLARALTTIETSYVDPIDSTTLIYGAVEGMSDHLDEHSFFMDPEAYAELQNRTEGLFYGVGVELEPTAAGVIIRRVIPGSPGELGGLQAGDRILRVDGASTPDMDAVLARIPGERGSPVQIDVARGNKEVPCTVVRDQVVERSVSGELLAPGFAYVRLDHFRRRAGSELHGTLSRLADESGGPLRGVVLDLRDNAGGLLDQAVEVVDTFVDGGLVLETRGRDGAVRESHRATPSPEDISASLVVLVNENSASAAEIVAGALQDLDRATLVGTPTYGKGSVQTVYTFSDGAALKLTIARYHLPSGRPILDHEGLQPDVIVPLPSPIDADLMALRSALETSISDPAQRSELVAQLDRIASRQPPASGSPVWQGSAAERLDNDPQLAAAWSTLQAGQ